MQEELKKAIDIVENAGGFVMLPESDKEEREVRKMTHQMQEKQLEELERMENEDESDFQKRKKEAFKEMNEVFNEPYFMAKGMLSQMNDLEDILLDNGVDLDYLEEWIESQY